MFNILKLKKKKNCSNLLKNHIISMYCLLKSRPYEIIVSL